MIMLDVIIALLPAAVASVIVFGPRSLLVTGACTASCIIFEFGFEKLCRRENTIGDLSAVVLRVKPGGALVLVLLVHEEHLLRQAVFQQVLLTKLINSLAHRVDLLPQLDVLTLVSVAE